MESQILKMLEDISKENKDLTNKLLNFIANTINSNNIELLNFRNFFIHLRNINQELHSELLVYLIKKSKYDHFFPQVCHYDKFIDTFNTENYEKYILDKKEPFAQRYSLFYYMIAIFFYIKKDQTATNNIYKELILEAKNYIPLKLTNKTYKKQRVFIYTYQYLKGNHAPSEIVREYASSFLKMNSQVTVISCTPKEFPYSLRNSFTINRPKLKNNEIEQLAPNLNHIAFYDDPISTNSYRDFVENNQLSINDILILVGNKTMHFDLLPNSKNKYIIPLSTKYLYTSATKYIASKEMDIVNFNNKNMEFIKGPTTFKENQLEIDFKSPNIKKNQIINIAIVGNRLDTELDEIFFSNIMFLVEKIPLIKLHIIGEFDKNHIPMNLKKYVILAGYQHNLEEYYRNMHFYLNPAREGGGFSAMLAIKTGLPVITLPEGDVFYAINEIYHIKDYKKIYKFIKEYINNKTKREKINKLTYKLSEKYKKDNQLEKVVKDIINKSNSTK